MVPLKPLLGNLSCCHDWPMCTDQPLLGPFVCTHIGSARRRFCAPRGSHFQGAELGQPPPPTPVTPLITPTVFLFFIWHLVQPSPAPHLTRST